MDRSDPVTVGRRAPPSGFAALRRAVGRAIADFDMIGDGDRVMVCVSGGKDSHTLLDALLALRRAAPVDFELVAVNLDQKQPGFPAEVLPAHFEALGVEYRVVERDTHSVVRRVIPEGGTACSLCSRLRRGILYSVAEELGATRIALGHHADDALETLLLNLFHNGRIKSMPPRLRSDDGRHTVIRPLAYCRERDIAAYSAAAGHPIVPCDLCGSQPNLRRRLVKAEIARWEAEDPSRVASMLTALGHVVPSHLADRTLHDFRAVAPRPGAGPDGGSAPARDGADHQGMSSPS